MILADENIPAKMIDAIKSIPLEVISVKQILKGEGDDRLIEHARKNNLIIVTEDKDFGEWIFAHHLPSAGVIFLRYPFKLSDRIIVVMTDFLKQHSKNIRGKFVTVTIDAISIRQL